MPATVNFNQLPVASQTVEPRGELITASFLNQYNLKLHPNIYPYIQASVVLISHQGSYLLQPMKIITENHRSSKCLYQLSVGCLLPKYTFTTCSLHLQHREHCRRAPRKFLRGRGPGHLLQDRVF